MLLGVCICLSVSAIATKVMKQSLRIFFSCRQLPNQVDILNFFKLFYTLLNIHLSPPVPRWSSG